MSQHEDRLTIDRRDIDIITCRVKQHLPEVVVVEQLKVTHPADDDGLWFFYCRATVTMQIQIESSNEFWSNREQGAIHRKCRFTFSSARLLEVNEKTARFFPRRHREDLPYAPSDDKRRENA